MNQKILIILINFIIIIVSIISQILREKLKFRLSYGKKSKDFFKEYGFLTLELSNRQNIIMRENLLEIKSISEKNYFMDEMVRLVKGQEKINRM